MEVKGIGWGHPALPTGVTLDLGVICDVAAPSRSLNSSLYQQETSKVILEETTFISDESASQSLPKQIASDL